MDFLHVADSQYKPDYYKKYFLLLCTRMATFGTVCMLLLLIISCSSKTLEHRGPIGSEDRPNVLLIVVDTLRADHLGCYGERRPTSPFIDSLARNGVLFKQAITVMPATLPSFSSILTSRVPRRHGVMVNGETLSSAQVTLTEILQIRGYHTAAFISSFVLDARFGVNQGFEYYNEELNDKERGEKGVSRRGEKTVDAVLSWTDRYPDKEPFFIMVHLWDPHWPYMPPKGYLEMVDRKHSDSITGTFENIMQVRKKLIASGGKPGDDSRQLDALYSGEVRYTDECVKRLLNGMETRGFLENTIVVFTADHGENMWEHPPNYFGHAGNIYHTSVHVPLIIMALGRLKGGKIIDHMVRSIDLAPTFLELLGIAPQQEFQGYSFAKLLMSDVSIHREEALPCFIEANGATGMQPRAVFDGQFKLIQFPYENNRYELFNLIEDPGEQNNLITVSEIILQSKTSKLKNALNEWYISNPVRRSLGRVQVSDDAREKLKALGYIN